MITRLAGRLFLALMVLVVIFSWYSGNAFAADKAKALELSKALNQVKLFAGLTDKERDALRSAATLRHGKDGERIIEQGKVLDRMFIVLEGQTEVLVNGKHIVTHSGQPLVGELEFLDLLPASADVILRNESDLIELRYAALNALMKKQPRLGYVLIREIAKIEAGRLRDSSAK